MTVRKTVQCASCGAPISGTASRCEYCGSHFDTAGAGLADKLKQAPRKVRKKKSKPHPEPPDPQGKKLHRFLETQNEALIEFTNLGCTVSLLWLLTIPGFIWALRHLGWGWFGSIAVGILASFGILIPIAYVDTSLENSRWVRKILPRVRHVMAEENVTREDLLGFIDQYFGDKIALRRYFVSQDKFDTGKG